jgi:hypothetical protein
MKFVGAHIFDYDATFRGDVTIEGNLTISNSVSQTISFGNNDKLKFGDNGEFEIYHDGTNSYINNTNNGGHLFIQTDQTDKDVVLKSDDGSGSMTAYITLDGSAGYTQAYKKIRYRDSVKAEFGDAGDLDIYHDGSNSYISQGGTGDLYITQNVDDKDIILKSDDGSGGVTAYLTLDGSAANIIFSQTSVVADDKAIMFGTDGDSFFKHTGSQFSFFNDTGPVIFYQRVDDGYIAFQSDDGSGGLTEYLRIDGQNGNVLFSKPITVGADDTGHDVIFYGATSDRYLQWDESDDSLKFRDNVKAKFGNGNDLALHHSGSQSEIKNLTGNLIIENTADDADIIFKTDDGSGGTATYLTLDGSQGFTTVQKKILFEDSVVAGFGNSTDLYISYNGSYGSIMNENGDLYISNNSDDGDIVFRSDDGSGGLTEYFRLNGGFSSPYTNFPDNSTLSFGGSNDLRIYHDGTDNNINSVNGHLKIAQYSDDSDIIFYSDNGSGGLAEYFRLDGGFSTPQVRIPDNVTFSVGSSQDLRLEHDGSDSRITQGGTGNLIIRQTVDDADLILQCDDGSGGNTAYITLDGSETEIHLHKPVGIGTTNPDTAYKLDVAGKVQVQSVLELDDVLTLNAISTPADPAAGKSSIYMDSSDGAIKVKINVGGTVVTRTIASYE